ncbi:MAG: hypothetical protein K1Y02_10165 [Candidatus Hydrogenedentes bacterium]|nr:hypothetical protein [Candidatus Hydrogenedentota bacterium]
MKYSHLSRRQFLARSSGLLAASALATANEPTSETADASIPHVDLHVHLDNSTIDAVAALAKERGVKFGIVDHAGTKENKYPTLLSNDAELEAYADMLEGKGVWKGVQAEYTDWPKCFSKTAYKRLDYVLGDGMTMPGPDGQRMKLWEAGAALGDAESFMDRYVEWHERRMTEDPIDIFANTTWMPDAFMPQYDALWTEARMKRVIDAAVKNDVALEICGGLRLPKMPFLTMAKAAGVKFSFGSNGRYPKMGQIEYCLEAAKTLNLTPKDIFVPGKSGPKAAQ